jgi:hypothetical protein
VNEERKIRLTPASEIEPQAYRWKWGPWLLGRKNYVLYVHPYSNGYRYEVDLEDCTTSARLADWVFQVYGKEWATAEILAGLIGALDDILNPQAHLCSSGKSKQLTAARIRALVERMPARRDGT